METLINELARQMESATDAILADLESKADQIVLEVITRLEEGD